MNISVEQQGGVVFLMPDGRLDAVGAPEIAASGTKIIQEGAKKLLLDMANVPYISSAGLRSLLVLAKAMKTAGGKLVLCSLAASVQEVMTISGFDAILTLAADRPAAQSLLN